MAAAMAFPDVKNNRELTSQLKSQLAAHTSSPIGRRKECLLIQERLAPLLAQPQHSSARHNPSIILYGPHAAGKHTCLYTALANLKFTPSNIVEIAKHELVSEATIVKHLQSRFPDDTKNDTLVSWQAILKESKEPHLFILPDIEKWAQTGASILYTLSEWMQPANGIRLGLVMLTERANAYDAFTKQLRSRMTCQTIVISGHVSVADCIEILRSRLLLSTESKSDASWNKSITQWLISKPLHKHIQRWVLNGRTVAHLLQLASIFVEHVDPIYDESNWHSCWTKALDAIMMSYNTPQVHAEPTQWQSFVIASWGLCFKLFSKVTPLLMVSHLSAYSKETKNNAVGSVPKSLLTEINFLPQVQEAVTYGWLEIHEKKQNKLVDWTTELVATAHCPIVSGLEYTDWIPTGSLEPILF